MKRPGLKWIVGIISYLPIIFITGCDKSEKDSGYLAGTISIGPLCPVERIPPDPGCLPTAETYKAYPVSVYSADGEDKITQLKPSLNGSFSCELPAGKYIVILENAISKIGNSNLPVNLSIKLRDTTRLNINIDTGIR
jgi:hypothetical protein